MVKSNINLNIILLYYNIIIIVFNLFLKKVVNYINAMQNIVFKETMY